MLFFASDATVKGSETMDENLKAFYQKLSEDEDLAREFQALMEDLQNDRAEAVIGFAQAHGIEIGEEDFSKLQSGALSDDDLGHVTGGEGMVDGGGGASPLPAARDNWLF